MAGQVIMQGFLHRQIPIWLRRLVTMVPALVVIAIGLDPTRTLVISQVVLSFGIPFALIPLVLFTRRQDLMGVLVNRRLTTVLAMLVAAADRRPQHLPAVSDTRWRVMLMELLVPPPLRSFLAPLDGSRLAEAVLPTVVMPGRPSACQRNIAPYLGAARARNNPRRTAPDR